MRVSTLHRRSLRFYWRTHVATALCAAAAATALTGSLLVGDSMRASLREQALRRLGGIDHALVAARFFREELASGLAGGAGFRARFAAAAPAVVARGAIELAGAPARVGRINVLGVDTGFWNCVSPSPGASEAAMPPGSVILNETLAHDLGARPGDDILLRLGAHQAAPVETLLGRTDQTVVSLRLTVSRVIPSSGAGGLDLTLTQEEPRNAFVPLADLQRALKQRGRVNAILVRAGDAEAAGAGNDAGLQAMLAAQVRLADLGLKLRPDPGAPAVVLESDRLFIEPAIEAAALAAAAEIGAPATPVLTYLANFIASVPPDAAREIPYSTVTAIGRRADGTLPGFDLMDGSTAPVLKDDEILLNEWAADDLRAAVGDQVRMTWYAPAAFHQLETESGIFTIRGIVKMEGLAADPTLAPEYEGITSAKRLTDWDPPFPVDMQRIRDRDESYWEEHGPTPKAFVALATGRQLWTRTQRRFGQSTSIRLTAAPGQDLATVSAGFERAFLRRLAPAAAGLVFQPLRDRALAASEGSTDFGVLFLSFSMFLIASAAMLTALLFRLGVQRRSTEIGLLLAVGFDRRAVARHLLAEAAWPAGLGATLGLLGAVGYSALMLAGLRSWWSGAVQADFLRLHVGTTSLAIGWAASLLVAMFSIAWSVRGLSRRPPREMLAASGGRRLARLPGRFSVRLPTAIALASLAAALLLVALSAAKRMPAMPAFFGSGAFTLMAALAGLRLWTRLPGHGVIRSGGLAAVARLGIRNAARNPLRTLLTAGLVASASFLITAVGANRLEANREKDREKDREKVSGTFYRDGPLGASHKRFLTPFPSATGGFALIAESTTPIVQDLNSLDGRRALGLSPACAAALSEYHVVPFRLRPGDEASCAGLYRPTQPRILGATRAMIERGGFAFRSSLARTAEQKANPWLLLDEPLPDGAVPTVGDDSTVTWLLHLGLGEDLVLTDEHGQTLRLRIVALLSGSVLQSELVISESSFIERFPSIGGYGFFLVEAAHQSPERERGENADLGRLLEQNLVRYGLEVTPAAARLARYLAVENAYLSAFQTLGGLGLILGTLGLGAVLWRNVLDRRGELALLAALGYRRMYLRWLVLAEHLAILIYGLAAGVVSALLAVAPQIASHPHNIPWLSLGLTLLAVLLTGAIVGALAVVPALRGPLPASLRND